MKNALLRVLGMAAMPEIMKPGYQNAPDYGAGRKKTKTRVGLSNNGMPKTYYRKRKTRRRMQKRSRRHNR